MTEALHPVTKIVVGSSILYPIEMPNGMTNFLDDELRPRDGAGKAKKPPALQTGNDSLQSVGTFPSRAGGESTSSQ